MEQLQPKQSKFFYGWIVVLGLTFIQGAAVGIVGNTLSTFITPITKDLQITRAAFTMYTTYGAIAGMIMAPFWGEIFKNRKLKPLMVAGSAIVALCMYGYSFATSVWHFYAIAAVKGVFQGALMGVPFAKVLSNWFVERRGEATGYALAGSGLAGAIMTPITTRTIDVSGWRAGFVQLAIVYLAITVPVLLLIIRETPEEMGLKAYGADKAPALQQVIAADHMKSGISRKQAFGTRTFWLYVAGLFCTSMCSTSMQNNIISHLTDIGYARGFASRVFSVYMITLVPGKILLGRLYDKAGMKKTTVFVHTLMFASAAALMFAGVMPLPFVFAVLFGFANTAATMQPPYLTVRLLGNKEYSRVYGVCQPFQGMGSAIGVPLSNLICDITGSYNTSFFAVMGLAVCTILLLTGAIRNSPRDIARCDAEDGLIPAQPSVVI